MKDNEGLQSTQGSYFIVQAYLAINPVNPHWCDIAKTSVSGWETAEKTQGRMRGYSYRHLRFWTDVLAWDNLQDAKAAFKVVMTFPQKHRLRLIRVCISHQESLTDRWVIHKNSRMPGRVSYTGPTLERAGLRSQYKEHYEDKQEAQDFAAQLTVFNPGVGFAVSLAEE